MIDKHLQCPWPLEVMEVLGRFKQGDLIERPPFFFGVRPGLRLWGASGDTEDADPSQVDEFHPDDAPRYGIITTQTCDINEQGTPTQPWLQVAPVYALEGEEDSDAESLKKNYIVRLTGSGLPPGVWVADLRLELPLEKPLLAGRSPISGFSTEEEAEQFGRLLGERRARAALGNELVESVTGMLRKRKANNKRSKKVWPRLYSIRLQIEEGSRLKPVAVRLHVISDEAPVADTRDWFDKWEDRAREEAGKVGITLHTTRHHHATKVDIRTLDLLIDLNID